MFRNTSEHNSDVFLGIMSSYLKCTLPMPIVTESGKKRKARLVCYYVFVTFVFIFFGKLILYNFLLIPGFLLSWGRRFDNFYLTSRGRNDLCYYIKYF